MINMFPSAIKIIKIKVNGKSNFDYDCEGALLFGLSLRELKQVLFCGYSVDLSKIDCLRTLKSYCKRYLNNVVVQFE